VSPEDVHNRLAQGDTLILIDVREISEFMNGHIAEPDGQLPITPALMPWNSNILSTQFSLLQGDVDIIVYCQSGGRSAAASTFLETQGFTGIYNMLGGFSSWIYESRTGGFGDHSGEWVNLSGTEPVTIICTETGDTSKIIFPPSAYSGTDSIYIELHLASSKPFLPPGVPLSDIEGLFRITVLDQYGLSLFNSDSLVLSNTANLSFHTDIHGNIIFDIDLEIFVTGEGWRSVDFDFNIPMFFRDETTLRKWYNASGFLSTAVDDIHLESKNDIVKVYPNPFNSTIHISAPKDAVITIYNIMGVLIKRLDSTEWIPEDSVTSGFYIVNIQSENLVASRKIVYLK
ncbi:rhodanese-like domain-containing protein, partial [Bacteroidota bacterium]